jgi:hypothetical protein
MKKQTFPKQVFEVESAWQLITLYNIGNHLLYSYINCIKGKAIPLQAWTGPEGSRRLRFTDFKTIGT